MGIEWKTVPGHLGLEVSSEGAVRLDGKNLYIQRMSHGYLRVNVRGKRITVHSLVALAFYGERPKGYDVRHLNGDRSDNRASNLAYGTRKENIGDAVRLGTHYHGERHYRAKLTIQQVKEIKQRAMAGERQKQIAAEFGIGADQVSRIKTGQRWKFAIGVA